MNPNEIPTNYLNNTNPFCFAANDDTDSYKVLKNNVRIQTTQQIQPEYLPIDIKTIRLERLRIMDTAIRKGIDELINTCLSKLNIVSDNMTFNEKMEILNKNKNNPEILKILIKIKYLMFYKKQQQLQQSVYNGIAKILNIDEIKEALNKEKIDENEDYNFLESIEENIRRNREFNEKRERFLLNSRVKDNYLYIKNYNLNNYQRRNHLYLLCSKLHENIEKFGYQNYFDEKNVNSLEQEKTIESKIKNKIGYMMNKMNEYIQTFLRKYKNSYDMHKTDSYIKTETVHKEEEHPKMRKIEKKSENIPEIYYEINNRRINTIIKKTLDSSEYTIILSIINYFLRNENTPILIAVEKNKLLKIILIMKINKIEPYVYLNYEERKGLKKSKLIITEENIAMTDKYLQKYHYQLIISSKPINLNSAHKILHTDTPDFNSLMYLTQLFSTGKSLEEFLNPYTRSVHPNDLNLVNLKIQEILKLHTIQNNIKNELYLLNRLSFIQKYLIIQLQKNQDNTTRQKLISEILFHPFLNKNVNDILNTTSLDIKNLSKISGIFNIIYNFLQQNINNLFIVTKYKEFLENYLFNNPNLKINPQIKISIFNSVHEINQDNKINHDETDLNSNLNDEFENDNKNEEDANKKEEDANKKEEDANKKEEDANKDDNKKDDDENGDKKTNENMNDKEKNKNDNKKDNDNNKIVEENDWIINISKERIENTNKKVLNILMIEPEDLIFNLTMEYNKEDKLQNNLINSKKDFLKIFPSIPENIPDYLNLKRLFANSNQNLEQRIKEIIEDLSKIKINGENIINPFIYLPDKNEYPEYYEVIKNPLSINCISSKKYNDYDEFINDLKIMFKNALFFNVEGSEIYNSAQYYLNYIDYEYL